jgi:hypothetical protein
VSPQRIQLSRAKGWRKPEGAVVVARGRGRRWGNPFRVEPCRGGEPGWWVVGGGGVASSADDDQPWTHAQATRYAVECFRQTIPPGSFRAHDARIELAGRDLCCWCPLDQPCHGDVLLEIANGETP